MFAQIDPLCSNTMTTAHCALEQILGGAGKIVVLSILSPMIFSASPDLSQQNTNLTVIGLDDRRLAFSQKDT